MPASHTAARLLLLVLVLVTVAVLVAVAATHLDWDTLKDGPWSAAVLG